MTINDLTVASSVSAQPADDALKVDRLCVSSNFGMNLSEPHMNKLAVEYLSVYVVP